MTQTITLRDVGPVHALDIKIPEGGGIVVLKGRNGVGKSATLAEINDRLLGQAGAVNIRQGALSASIEGLGREVHVTLGKRASHRGQLQVSRLSGVDPSTLIDPGIDSPESADLSRLKTLCSLAGADVPVERFAELVGGMDELSKIAKGSSLDADLSLPQRAAAIKRDFQSKARDVEADAQRERGKVDGLRQAVAGVDLDAPANDVQVRSALEESIRSCSVLETRQTASRIASNTAEESKRKLEEATNAYSGPTAEAALVAFGSAGDAFRQAQEQLRSASEELARADAQLKLAASNEKLVAGWYDAIRAAEEAGPGPSDLEVEDARAAVAKARADADRAAVVRHARTQHEEAEAAADRAKRFAARADVLRTAADQCESLLSEAIAKLAPRGLRMKNGRMILDTSRGETFFADLSFGERARIVLEIAAKAIGSNGLLVVDQGFWEGLDGGNRSELAAIAREVGCTILTAECDDGELRAEVA